MKEIVEDMSVYIVYNTLTRDMKLDAFCEVWFYVHERLYPNEMYASIYMHIVSMR